MTCPQAETQSHPSESVPKVCRKRGRTVGKKWNLLFRAITIDANDEFLFTFAWSSSSIGAVVVGRTSISFVFSLSSTRYQYPLSLGQRFVGFGKA